MRRRIWMALVMLGVLVRWPQAAEAVILINEVLADPSVVTGDANGDGVPSTTQDEFIELVNTGSGSVSLANWSVSDAVRTRHVFGAEALIPGFGFFTLFGGGSPQGFADVATASSGGLGLNNTGDTITLTDATAAFIDTVSYGTEGGADVSLTRFPDATSGFVQHSSVGSAAFSPGRTVDGALGLPHPSDEPPAVPVIPEQTADDAPHIPPPLDEPPAAPVVPEPSSLFLIGSGICGMVKMSRAKSRYRNC